MNTPTTNYIEIDGEGKYIEDTDCREMATTAQQTIDNFIQAFFNPQNNATTDAPRKYVYEGNPITYNIQNRSLVFVNVSKYGHGNTVSIFLNNKLVYKWPVYGDAPDQFPGERILQNTFSAAIPIYCPANSVLRIEGDSPTLDQNCWYVNNVSINPI